MSKLQLSFSPESIERVRLEWERKHPGKVADRDLTPEEFADLMMGDAIARAEIINEPDGEMEK